MAEWQQYLQTVFFGVVFSFLLAKLFSVIFAFHDENLRLTRSGQTESESKPEFEGKSPSSPLLGGIGNEGLVKESSVISDHRCSDSDDDWEGVESTELDRKFSAATAYVAEIAADRAAKKASNDAQLQLYGLYKIATEGPCSAPQPSAIKMTARAKWQAWQKLGAMPPEEAMQKYIDIVSELYPSWDAGSRIKKKEQERSDAHVEGSEGPMGPVFSTFTREGEPGSELKLDAIHTFAKEGDEEKLLECIESGVPLNLKDNEGQTALHYAAACERGAIAELLVEKGADIQIKDDEGHTPGDLSELSWPWMQIN